MADTARAMFSEELKAHREQASLTQEVLATKANVSLSLLKKIETCERRPQRDFALWCDSFFGSPGTFERFHRLTLLETFPEWFASRVLLEEQAASLTEWEIRVIPGLLQTRAYAQTLIRTGRPFDPEEDLVREIDGRIERQEILHRDDAPQLWVVIAEGPLHQTVGGTAVMREQLEHLIDMADSSKCVIQILPFSDTAAPGIDGPATLFEFADKPSVAYIDGWDIGWVIHDATKVTRISTTLNMIKSCALSPADSRHLMITIRNEL